MYNHARTLLVNLPGSTVSYANVPYDELIPAGYAPVKLPTYMEAFRSRLFGVSPDRAMLNYRMVQLLTMIETTQLQSHILELDPRITYNNYSTKWKVNTAFEPTVVKYLGSDNSHLDVLGNSMSPDASGISGYEYLVTTDGTNITVARQTNPVRKTSEVVVLDGGLSQVVSLPLSGYKVRVNTANTAGWTLRGCLRPTTSLSNIEQTLRSVGEPYLLQLFGTPDVEPYLTFRNCWKKHPEFAYRLGGLVLAMIYRTEEIRNA